MTRSDYIADLERIRRELGITMNHAYVDHFLGEEGKLWLGSSMYGIQDVINKLRQDERETRLKARGTAYEGQG